MDYNGAEPTIDHYGDDGPHNQYEDEEYPQEMYSEQQHQPQQHYPRGDFDSNLDDSRARHESKHSIDDSSAGKLFVGGIAWETSEESFTKYFSKYGEISDSVIMMDKFSGRPRGFGFVTFADPEVVNRVLQEDHVIDGRTVEVKRTVPRENMQAKGVVRTKKIFVGGIPLSLTEDDLQEYFSSYGKIIEHQIMFDHTTGRSRGFGFVTFETEDAVERIFSDGRMHELAGKRVEIKRAEPKRAGFDHGQDNRMRRGSSSSKSYGGFDGDQTEFGGGYGKMSRGYGGYNGYGGYGGYGSYPGNFSGGATGFYPGYGGYGYGFGFGGPMYGGSAGYGGGGYGNPAGYGVSNAYGGGKGYDATGYGGGGSASGYGGAKGYGAGGGSGGGASKAYSNGGSASGRFHPYRK